MVSNGSISAVPATEGDFDYDWLIVGSGFGGSVSALRLAETGYRVGRALAQIPAGGRPVSYELPEAARGAGLSPAPEPSVA